MKFSESIDILSSALSRELPGLDAQMEMAPRQRNVRMPDEEVLNGAKRAGVLVLFYPHPEDAHVVFMVRNEYPGVHSGQVSFPGGKKEEEDKDLVETALREAEEEVGVERNSIEVIGQLSQLYIPPSNFLVQPVVAVSKVRPTFVPDPTEVAALLEVPVKLLMDPKIKGVKDLELRENLRINTPYFDVHGHTVWGATAMMLSELLVLLRD